LQDGGLILFSTSIYIHHHPFIFIKGIPLTEWKIVEYSLEFHAPSACFVLFCLSLSLSLFKKQWQKAGALELIFVSQSSIHQLSFFIKVQEDKKKTNAWVMHNTRHACFLKTYQHITRRLHFFNRNLPMFKIILFKIHLDSRPASTVDVCCVQQSTVNTTCTFTVCVCQQHPPTTSDSPAGILTLSRRLSRWRGGSALYNVWCAFCLCFRHASQLLKILRVWSHSV
jgi:hypothetical protein